MLNFTTYVALVNISLETGLPGKTAMSWIAGNEMGRVRQDWASESALWESCSLGDHNMVLWWRGWALLQICQWWKAFVEEIQLSWRKNNSSLSEKTLKGERSLLFYTLPSKADICHLWFTSVIKIQYSTVIHKFYWKEPGPGKSCPQVTQQITSCARAESDLQSLPHPDVEMIR